MMIGKKCAESDFFTPFGPIKTVNKMAMREKKASCLTNLQCKVNEKHVDRKKKQMKNAHTLK